MDLSVVTETFGQDDQSWIGAAHGIDLARSITLDTSAFTEATHYPDGYILSGTPLGRITATGLYGPYDNTTPATDGREVRGWPRPRRSATTTPRRASADVRVPPASRAPCRPSRARSS